MTPSYFVIPSFDILLSLTTHLPLTVTISLYYDHPNPQVKDVEEALIDSYDILLMIPPYDTCFILY